MLLQNAKTHRQPEPHSAPHLFGGKKRLENPGSNRLRDTATVIGDGHRWRGTLTGHLQSGFLSAVESVLSIEHEVQEDLVELIGIGMDGDGSQLSIQKDLGSLQARR